MSNLKKRITAVEVRLLPKPAPQMLGSYEKHYTEAWPECKDYPGIDVSQCTEHGPTCAVVITRISAPIHRIIVLNGATAGPWMISG
jgi:hypothetical protein